MKPKLWDGANPVGESQVAPLSQIDVPYLTHAGVDNITYKKDGFYEVRVNQSKPLPPYLTGTYGVGTSVFFLNGNPKAKYGLRQVYKNVLSVDGGYVDYQALKVFVGDNYLLRMVASTVYSGMAYLDLLQLCSFWMVLQRIDKLGTEVHVSQDPQDPLPKGKSISYSNTTLVVGTFIPSGAQYGQDRFPVGRYFALFASGWSNADERFRFGFGACIGRVGASRALLTGPNSSGNFPYVRRRPVVYLASTGELRSRMVDLPSSVDRDYSPFNVGVLGRGKLRCLLMIMEEFAVLGGNSVLPRIAPQLVTSDDHGDTWSSVDATFLTAHLRNDGGISGDRGCWKNDPMEMMGKTSVVVGIGDNKSILMIPNGYLNDGIPGQTGVQHRAMAFLGDEDGNYTRIAWPADAWRVGEDGGRSFPTEPTVALFTLASLRNAQLSFGVGCLYVPVYYPAEVEYGVDPGQDFRIMSTRDSGTTWTISGPVPINMVLPNMIDGESYGGWAFAFTVITPYIDGDNPGRLVICAPNYAEDKLAVFFTDGNFETFTLLGVMPHKDGAMVAEQGIQNHYFVNYGGTVYKPYVYPAFPGAFEKPSA